MSPFVIAFLLANMAALLLLPRRWAPLPFLLGACYITRSQLVLLGPFNFSVIRLLIATGIARTIIRGEALPGRLNGLDRLMVVWAIWMAVSSLFHTDPLGALVYRLGLAYDACGIYFLLRFFCRTFDDVLGLCRLTAILLVPVALEMCYEKLTDYNLFQALGRNVQDITVREGNIRAQGPFGHAVLAGTIGAVCLPLMVSLWRQHRQTAVLGIATCLVIVLTSASSGPILSTAAAVAALLMWRHRNRMRFVRWMMIAGYIALDLVMKDPAYFIMARVDFVGGSTGWYRARLIQSAIEHLPEWWLGGTDYTRHWMPSGVSWSPQHTDITNHYLQSGVIGGLPLMLLFIAVLAKGFSFVGQTIRQTPDLSLQSRIICWALGSSLFAHATTFVSVSYFDQSFVFIYLTLAAIGSIQLGTANEDAYRIEARGGRRAGSAAAMTFRRGT